MKNKKTHFGWKINNIFLRASQGGGRCQPDSGARDPREFFQDKVALHWVLATVVADI